jgi:hypothetical protein
MAAVADLVRDVRQVLQQCPALSIQFAYVRAARQFCQEARWLRRVVSATLVANRQYYSLGSDPLLEVLALGPVQATTPVNPATGQNIVSLSAADPATFDPNQTSGFPMWYAYVPEAQIGFNPKPNAAYPVTITLVVQPRDGVADLPDELLVKWRYAFEEGAKWFLYEIPGEPWSDPQKAQLCRANFRSYVNEARADVNRGFQQGPVRARPRAPWVV